MIGHLGQKVTALLDGQLPLAEEERAWEHVHTCHGCRDAIEREGWVKTQLAQWSVVSEPCSAGVRDALLARSFAVATPLPASVMAAGADQGQAGGRGRHVVTVGGSALGVAVMGVIALGTAPANAPLPERRTITTSIVGPTLVSEPRSQVTAGPSSTVSVRLRPASDKMVP